MPDREKLFDLMMRDPCPHPVGCSAHCQYYKSQHCHAERYADHLIANGVTFAADNNAGGKWIPVTERLPSNKKVIDGETYFKNVAVRVKDLEFEKIAFYDDEEKCWFDPEFFPIAGEVTHWCDLPEPPKEE